jgi:hypothetical protein
VTDYAPPQETTTQQPPEDGDDSVGVLVTTPQKRLSLSIPLVDSISEGFGHLADSVGKIVTKSAEAAVDFVKKNGPNAVNAVAETVREHELTQDALNPDAGGHWGTGTTAWSDVNH